MSGREAGATTARERMLANVRRALGRAAGQLPASLAAPRLQILLSDRKVYTSLFVQNFENLGGKSMLVRENSAVSGALASLLEGKRVVVSNSPFLADCGITKLAGVQSGFTDRDALRGACVDADIGITSTDYALADTGTLVLLASPSEARMISLLPPVHVAVLPRSRLLANLDELFGILPGPAEETSSMVMITGPSRTADIEQILVRGVHGPGEIYAVIVG